MGKLLRYAAICACASASLSCISSRHQADQIPKAKAENPFERAFESPSSTAKPWVYWYFMDGNITREGLTADLEAMRDAGIGGAIFLTVDIGVPRGPVAFMSPAWQELFLHAVREADRLGIEITLGVGPGWTGTGGPWVKPEDAMQHLVGTATTVTGGGRVELDLPRPQPREPFFGRGPFTPALLKIWQEYYEDVAVIAYPTPQAGAKLDAADEKALYYRAPYSSAPNVRPLIEPFASPAAVPGAQCLDRSRAIVLTDKLGPDGRLRWDAPEGEWTVYRFGRTLTGQTSRPAPLAGLGLESDKLSKPSLEAHFKSFLDPLLNAVGRASGPNRGLTLLHLDSWEMGSQNWSPQFREEFQRRRGYDPLPYLPAYLGQYVGDASTTERFLWDVRETARELLFENHALVLRDYAHRNGLQMSAQSYDMNPSGDLRLGSIGDVPMGEFWTWGIGFSTEFSVAEAVSIAHTNGKPIVGGEAFTAESPERWQQYPARMKAQTDWAFAAGLNRFVIHRYQHQPKLDEFPGMRMGEYGIHWERTQTFWPLVKGYHDYLSRCSDVLRIGLPVADILYLAPEGSPQVFRAPRSATWGERLDRRGYNFDGCDPDTLIDRATVVDGMIRFPDGMSYRVLVLPRFDTMTPRLLQKVKELLEAGATVIGSAPRKSPSLSGQPNADAEVAALSRELWGNSETGERQVGKGRLFNDRYPKPAIELADPVGGAKWIWHDDGTTGVDVPPQTRYFDRRFSVDSMENVKSAVLWIAADNSCEIYVNGKKVGGGDNRDNSPRLDVLGVLKSGENLIRVAAVNAGSSPNPAGVIGFLNLTFADDQSRVIATDADWTSSESEEGVYAKVKVINDLPRGWLSAKPPAEFRDVYPDYDATAGVLRSMSVVPDVESDLPLRYTHRRQDDVDLYFIANPGNESIQPTVTFRASGRNPEWWNPLTGKRPPLEITAKNSSTTSVSLSLAPTESGFVVFRPGVPRAPERTKASSSQVRLDLTGPWTVNFDPRWGGPAQVKMSSLADWSTQADPSIRFYSGQATYRSKFDVEAPALTNSENPFVLSLGDVKVIARAKLNGHDLGIVWCPPWKLEVPAGVLRPKGNELEITVANQWTNRLIGDAALPVEKRLTKTSSNPFNVGDALQSSGLLGPVSIQTASE